MTDSRVLSKRGKRSPDYNFGVDPPYMQSGQQGNDAGRTSVPFRIFIGNARIVAPLAGSWSTFATFSSP